MKFSEIVHTIEIESPEDTRRDIPGDFFSIQDLEAAGPTDISFFFADGYRQAALMSKAGLLIAGKSQTDWMKSQYPDVFSRLKDRWVIAKNPYLSMAKLSACFADQNIRTSHIKPILDSIVHSTAVIDSGVRLPESIHVGPYVVIGKNVRLAEGVVLYPHVVIGDDCDIGPNVVVFPHVTLMDKVRVGARTRIHSGCVIGADGFGYAQEFSGSVPVRHQKIYHWGAVVIGSDVEIGANTTIDRGTFGETVIEDQAKLDNLVQVGHNCRIGRGSVLCGMSGMAGSSSTGQFAVLGAQAGTGNQVHIGDYARLGGYTGASKDVPAGAEMMGMPARPRSEFAKIQAYLNKLLKSQRKS